MSGSFLDRLVARGAGTGAAAVSPERSASDVDRQSPADLEVEETVDAIPRTAAPPPALQGVWEPAARPALQPEPSSERAGPTARSEPVSPPPAPGPLIAPIAAAPTPAARAIQRAPEAGAALARAAPAATLPQQGPVPVALPQPAAHRAQRDEPLTDEPPAAASRLPAELPVRVHTPDPEPPSRLPEPTVPVAAVSPRPAPVEAFTGLAQLADPELVEPVVSPPPRAAEQGDEQPSRGDVKALSAPPVPALPTEPRAEVPPTAAPAPAPTLEIGMIEIRLEPPATAPSVARVSGPPPVIGFDDYASVRSYAR